MRINTWAKSAWMRQSWASLTSARVERATRPWEKTGVPGFVGFTHFHSSTISGSASWMIAGPSRAGRPLSDPRRQLRLVELVVHQPRLGANNPQGTARPREPEQI